MPTCGTVHRVEWGGGGELSGSNYDVDTNTAKQQFFLKPADLAPLDRESVGGGVGCGRPSWFYKHADLEQAALRKHGHVGLEKKRAARRKRENKKRKEYEAAAVAAEALLSNKKAKTTGASKKVLDSMRTEVTRSLKPLLTWNYLRSKNSRNGCVGVARIERVDQQMYSSLVGRGEDPELKSLVKKGAWYSCSVSAKEFFGDGQVPRGKGGKFGCNADLSIDDEMILKYCPATSTMSVTVDVKHIDCCNEW